MTAVNPPSSGLSPLLDMTRTTPTCLWNDSASTTELAASIADGAVGATCNPVIALTVVKNEISIWKTRIREILSEHATATEDEISWQVVREMSLTASRLLLPLFEQHAGRNGRLSIQTDPRLYRNSAAMLAQAEEFHGIAPNMIVKLPVTRAGVEAIEEATFRGISINATVSFSLPQCVAVAEAVERGLARREQAGIETASMGPVCTIMVGRLDDWLKVQAERDGIIVNPEIFDWAGVAVFKKTYALYRQRGYRTRLLSAAFRNHRHWSEFIGGDVVISPPFAWQQRFNASGISPVARIENPVPEKIVDELYRTFTDFRAAYDEGGLAVEQFDSFPPSRRTLRQFIGACAELNGIVRDIMLPNPDKKSA